MPNLHLLKLDALPKLGDNAVRVVQGLSSSLRWLSLAGADGVRSQALSTLLFKLRDTPSPFAKVKQMVQDLISRLESEAEAEASQKADSA